MKLKNLKCIFYFKIGTALQKLDQWDKATNLYKKAIKLDDSNALWNFRLGYAFQKLGQWDKRSK